MLHHWLITVPKTPLAESSVVERISTTLGQYLYYQPDDAFLHRFEPGCYVMSVSLGADLWRIAPPFSLSANGFIAVAGVPTLEAAGNADEPILTSLRRILHRDGPDRLYQTVGGTFSVGCLDAPDGGRIKVSALSDFSGYNSVYYLESSEYFAIGNRASFVGAFRAGYPGRHEVDHDVLSWLPGTTMIMGTRTPFAGVSRLRTGYRLSLVVDRDTPIPAANIARMSPHHFGSDGLGRTWRPRRMSFRQSRSSDCEGIDSVDFEAACTRMAERAKWCLSRGVRFRAHLTGGRDTRVIAGILAARDAIQSVEQFTSMGTEENGDVIVARQVARTLGLADRHVVAPGGKVVSTLSAEDFHAALLRSTFVFDGHLSAWDGRRQPSARVPPWVTLMGGGGEIYRQEWGSSKPLMGDDGPRHALNMFTRHDVLGLLSNAAREYQFTEIKRELQILRDEGAVNLACAFYMEERLANWGCGHFTNAIATQFPFLLDRELARIVFAYDEVSEDVHFELLRHCGRGLLSVPFLNKKWTPDTEARAKRLGSNMRPTIVPVEHNFPWQYTCYRTYRNALIDFCLECGGSVRDQVPALLLERLRRSPVEPFGSAHVKKLFGLCGAICLATGASQGKRDAPRTVPTRMSGNHIAMIAQVIEEDEVSQHDVANRLWFHLNSVARHENSGQCEA